MWAQMKWLGIDSNKKYHKHQMKEVHRSNLIQKQSNRTSEKGEFVSVHNTMAHRGSRCVVLLNLELGA
jgi:hypothetical protein